MILGIPLVLLLIAMTIEYGIPIIALLIVRAAGVINVRVKHPYVSRKLPIQ